MFDSDRSKIRLFLPPIEKVVRDDYFTVDYEHEWGIGITDTSVN